ncbi:hypothetical protein KDK_05700 [Dictyobacter kobayashii]|uniref:HTH-like domain-containing protein n=1 Tax=Dictyobacter kobayashii TaxID=2014872 RepID=A0A402ACD6_9CHLR|nr:hypothetical protein KDK_05700 [Dictyobacter kobayashii]
MSTSAKLIDPNDPQLSIGRQCELLGLARSSYYYQPVAVSEEDLMLMRLLDEQYTRTPFYGTRKMTKLAQPTRLWSRTQTGPSPASHDG